MTSSTYQESLADTLVNEDFPAQAYNVVPTSADKLIVEVRPAGAEIAPPIYTAKLSHKKSPDVKLWVGSDIDAKPVASAAVDKETVSAILTIHGETINIGNNPQNGNTLITHPKLGKLKWKVKFSGNPGTLVDESGTEYAKHKTVGMHYQNGPRELTLLRAGDAEFFEMVLMTVIIARRLSGITQENMSLLIAAT